MIRKLLVWAGYSLPFPAKSGGSESQRRPDFKQREKESPLRVTLREQPAADIAYASCNLRS